MTEQEKQLLLIDLCARLPHHLKCVINGLDGCILQPEDLCDFIGGGFEIKPYLRPMSSSMTEEESKELKELIDSEYDEIGVYFLEGETLEDYLSQFPYKLCFIIIDWLNAHHFDYRGLIEKRLAIEVTEENNPYKN